MKNDIIAIRLTDSWTTNVQIISVLRMTLEKFGVEVIEDAGIPVHAQQTIPREWITQAGFPVLEFAKENIAKGIAKELLDGELIRFSEDEDRRYVYITGTLDVVKTKKQTRGE